MCVAAAFAGTCVAYAQPLCLTTSRICLLCSCSAKVIDLAAELVKPEKRADCIDLLTAFVICTSFWIKSIHMLAHEL